MFSVKRTLFGFCFNFVWNMFPFYEYLYVTLEMRAQMYVVLV